MNLSGETVSHYKILEELGRGGMGVVYRAEDLKLKRIVALKFLHPDLLGSEEDRTRFIQEAQAASALNHSNITTIHEIDEAEDPSSGEKQTFIVMEYVEGQSVKARLSGGSLGTEVFLDTAISIAEGLAAAHDREIIHRDIKAENIMISPEGQVKIMDFGLAKRKGVEGVTKPGMTPGTLAYMSPEQCEGKQADLRSDLFSFGVVMYEMATGSLPFRGEHEAALIYSIVNESPVPVSSLNPELPNGLDGIVSRALEKHPPDRYQSAGDILSDLKNLKKSVESGDQIERPEVRRPKRRSIPYLLVAAAAVILLIFGLPKIAHREPPPVLSEETALSVLYFENLMDPQDRDRLGQIVQELIIADLSGMSGLKVFSSQRLFDIQKQLGLRDRRTIDPELATEVAKRAGSNTMLTGRLFQAGENTILSSQLVDVTDGSVIASQRVDGSDIYSMVDELSGQIHEDLSLSPAETAAVEVAVKEKTTSTVDVYQHYLTGVDLFNDSRFDSAVVHFQQAIALDSSFTQAYYKLAIAQWWSQSAYGEATSKQAEKTLSKILTGDLKASTKEKLLAEGALALIGQKWDEAQEIFERLVDFIPDEKEAWFGLGEAYFHGSGDHKKSMEAFQTVLRFDPEFTQAYWHIFDIYSFLGLYEQGLEQARQFLEIYPDKPTGHFYLGQMLKAAGESIRAVAAFEKAVELDPEFTSAHTAIFNILYDEGYFEQGIDYAGEIVAKYPDKVWPYEFLGMMYRGKGELERAMVSFQHGLSLDPEERKLVRQIGYTYQLMGRYDEASSRFSELLDTALTSEWQFMGIFDMIGLYSEQGRYRKAMEFGNEKLSLASSLGVDFESNLLRSLGFISHIIDDTTNALRHLDRAALASPLTENILWIYLIKGLLRARWNQEEKLDVIIESAREIVQEEEVEKDPSLVYNVLLASQFALRGEVEMAFSEMDTLVQNPGFRDMVLYEKALLHLELGEYENALEIAEVLQGPQVHRDFHYYVYPRSFYIQGRAYEAMGELNLARKSYVTLLGIWEDADAEFSELEDTRRRLSGILELQG